MSNVIKQAIRSRPAFLKIKKDLSVQNGCWSIIIGK